VVATLLQLRAADSDVNNVDNNIFVVVVAAATFIKKPHQRSIEQPFRFKLITTIQNYSCEGAQWILIIAKYYSWNLTKQLCQRHCQFTFVTYNVKHHGGMVLTLSQLTQVVSVSCFR
jgi:hypothetical protein